jgi:hypothetical protein
MLIGYEACGESIYKAVEAYVARFASILFTDEWFFSRNGTFNIHNYHVWADENPRVIHVNAFQHRFIHIASICGLGFWEIHWQVFINKRLSDEISTVEFQVDLPVQASSTNPWWKIRILILG